MDRGTKHVTLEVRGQVSGWGNAYISFAHLWVGLNLACLML